MLHYYPRHVSIINMPIFRRKSVFSQHLVSSLSVNGCTVHLLRADCSPLLTGVLCSHLQRATITDAVRIKFVLLKMGMLMLETCRG